MNADVKGRWARILATIPGWERRQGSSGTRGATVIRGAAWAVLGQGAGVVVTIAVAPMTIGYLGTERYGIWATLGSIVAWLRMADLGIGNGLISALASADGRGAANEARRWIASAAALLLAASLFAGVALAGVWSWLDWSQVLGVTESTDRAELAAAVGAVFLLFVLELPLSPLDRVFAAVREGRVGNLWALGAHVASLAGVVTAMAGNGGLVAVVVGFTGGRLAVLFLACLWLFGRRRRDLRPSSADVERERSRALARTGGLFFVIQGAALVLYNTDNIVIANVLGADAVTPYAVAWRLFILPPAAMSLLFPYLWAAYAEALGSGDRSWVASTFRRSVKWSAISALALASVLVLVGKAAVGVLAGPDVEISSATIVWMGAWSFLLSWMNAVACFLNAQGRLRVQAAFGAVGAAANVALSFAWARRFGVEGVIAATVVTYVGLIVGPSVWDSFRALRALREEGAQPADSARTGASAARLRGR